MRLSKAPLQPPVSILTDIPGDFSSDVEAASELSSRRASQSSTSRIELRSPSDLCNIQGWIELPTTFGSLYLGEPFQSCVSVNNTSNRMVTAVHCKVELETARGKVTLLDTGAEKIDLPTSGRREYLVRHDVKEVGQHTLVCSAAYTTAEGDRRYLPQYFKFASTNPLSVRTKSRRVNESVLLEACIENNSRTGMVLEGVTFDAAQGLTATEIVPDSHMPSGSPAAGLPAYINDLKVISPSGGALNLVYRLDPRQSDPLDGSSIDGGSSLGRLDIRWRTPLGDLGRLQTQPITAAPTGSRDPGLKVVSIPGSAALEVPFSVEIRANVDPERFRQGLQLSCKAESDGGKVMRLGPSTISIEEDSCETTMDFVAFERGVQKLPEIFLGHTGASVAMDALNLSIWIE